MLLISRPYDKLKKEPVIVKKAKLRHISLIDKNYRLLHIIFIETIFNFHLLNKNNHRDFI